MPVWENMNHFVDDIQGMVWHRAKTCSDPICRPGNLPDVIGGPSHSNAVDRQQGSSMSRPRVSRRRPLTMIPISGLGRLAVGAAIGLVVDLGVGFAADPALGLLVGFTVAGAFAVIVGWLAPWTLNAAATQASVVRESVRPLAEEAIIVAASSCGLVGIVMLLVLGSGADETWAAAIAPLGVATGWAGLQLTYRSVCPPLLRGT